MATATRPKRTSVKAPTKGPRDPATRYAESVVAGKVIAGKLVRLACQRHLTDLVDGPKRGLVWDVDAVTRVIGFFKDTLCLAGGQHEGKPFILQPWQCFIVGLVFGWKRADGTRRFRTAYVEAGKGSGKSPVAAGTGIYCLTADGEPRAEVYAGASKKDQAQILFRDAVAMVDQSPALSKRLTKSGVAPVWNLAYHATGSFFRPIASDMAQSGPRPHCALLDEIHEHENDVVVAQMRAGTKGRRQALLFEITNSGWDRTSVCWQHHEYSRQILEGALVDDEWFAYVCGLDEGDDWRNEKVWLKANPNLGVTITKDYLRRQVREAEGMPAQQSLVRRLNFCEWTEQANPWVEMDVWNKNADAVQPIAGRTCFGGLDLSTVRDLSAFVRLFPPDDEGVIDVECRFWMPKDNIQRRVQEDRVPYDQWARDGLIELTEGNRIDYDVIRARIQDDGRVTPIQELGFDPYNATQLTTQLAGDGFTMVEVRQGYLSMSPPMKELEKLLLEGKIRHGGNPVLRWMVSNVAVVMDPAGNKKAAKNKSSGRIDGVVALIMAMSRLMVQPPPAPPPSVWVMG